MTALDKTLVVISNPDCYGVGYTNVVTGKFYVRKVVWGRLLARAEKRGGETIKLIRLEIRYARP